MSRFAWLRRKRTNKPEGTTRTYDPFARVAAIVGLLVATGSLVISYLNYSRVTKEDLQLECEMVVRSRVVTIAARDSDPAIGLPCRCVLLNTGGAILTIDRVAQAIGRYHRIQDVAVENSDGSAAREPIQIQPGASQVVFAHLLLTVDPVVFDAIKQEIPTEGGPLTDKVLRALHKKCIDVRVAMNPEDLLPDGAPEPQDLDLIVLTTRHGFRRWKWVAQVGTVAPHWCDELRRGDDL